MPQSVLERQTGEAIETRESVHELLRSALERALEQGEKLFFDQEWLPFVLRRVIFRGKGQSFELYECHGGSVTIFHRTAARVARPVTVSEKQPISEQDAQALLSSLQESFQHVEQEDDRTSSQTSLRRTASRRLIAQLVASR